RLLGNTRNFIQTLLDFTLNRVQVGNRVGAVCRLYTQLSNPLNVVINFVQSAFGRLGNGNAVVSVTGCLCEAANVSREAVSNSLTSGIILGAIDAQAGGQALDGGAEGRLRFMKVALGNQGKRVGVDD